MRLLCVALVLAVSAGGFAKDCPVKKSNSKLFCYYSKLKEIDCSCSHVILPANSDFKSVERAREHSKGVKILVTVNEFNQGLIDLLKTSKVDGLEINLLKLDSKEDINDFISTVKSKIGTDLYLALSVPAKAELLAKYYDFKSLTKHTDAFILQTAFLGASKNVTFHPSRLSGLWDMQNTDSIVDLVSGLGAPLSKVVITAPVQAFHFTLQKEEFSAPGSPALEVKSITRNELCDAMSNGANWTLERDQDQAGPYIFSKNKWIAFEDASSIDIKAKYSRVRGLAGLALKDLSQDGGDKCGPTILEAASEGLTRQARAPRGAVLHSLEREIQESSSRHLDSVQLSPYRISRVIDTEGHWHVIRQDTRTEFTCSRQGYFVHPRSCNRFYRCVKFDQRSDEFSVFEFDCPAGLAFDERVEVCVWPGSLPEGKPCAGSSEIAPVPKERFVCPNEPGYFADPENCRWFFACMDHGESHLTAYEFRCPYGLVYDAERLLCEWPWLVPKCASGSGLGINLKSQFIYGSTNTIGLDQYDGLGRLGAVKLGGVSGHIEQPIIYSNIGTTGYQNGGEGIGTLGYNAHLSLQNAGLLKTNSGAASGQYHLENAGADATSGGYVASGNTGNYLLNNAVNNDRAGQNYIAGAGVGIAADAHSNMAYSQDQYRSVDSNRASGSSSYQYNSGNVQSQVAGGSKTSYTDSSYEHDLTSSNQFLAGQAGDNANINLVHGTSVGFGEKVNQEFANLNSKYSETGSGYQAAYGHNLEQGVSSQDIQDYTSSQDEQYRTSFGQKTNLGGTNIYSSNAGLGALVHSGNADLQSETGSSSGGYQNNFAYSSGNKGAVGGISQGFVQYHNKNEGIAVNSLDNSNGVRYESTTVGNYAGSSGATSSANFVQYHSANEHQGVAGSINIVGGGYSAVGAAKSGIEITNNGENYDGILHSTASPVTVTTFASVPTASSVPLPSLKTATGFTSYNGGVVANVPEYQLRVEGGLGYPNNPSDFVKFVSSTPSTLHVSRNHVESEEESLHNTYDTGSSYAYQSYSNNGGYAYDKPSVAFEDGKANIQGNGNSQATYTYQTSYGNNGGYVYDKPQVAFEEKVNIQEAGKSEAAYNSGKSYSYQTSYAGNGGYVYDKPKVAFDDGNIHTVTVSTSRPAVSYGQKNIVQSTAGESGIFVQSTPSTVYQETPVQVYTQHTTVRPVTVVEQKLQPVISTTLRPVTFVQETVKPQVYVQPQTVVSQPATSFSYHKHEAASSGYTYDKPSIKFEQVVQPHVSVSSPNIDSTVKPIYQQPQVFVSTTAVPIVQEKVAVQPSSSYSYIKNGGYSYQKPVEQLPYQEFPNERIVSKFSIRKPVEQQTYVQPTMSTYSYQQEVNNGYNYEKPSVTFEERVKASVATVVQPVQPSTYSPPIGNTYVQPSTYSPPVVHTYVQPSTYSPPISNTYIKPAEVSSYFYQKPPATKYGYKDVVQQAIIQKEVPVSTYLPVTQQPKIVYATTPKSTYLPSVAVQPTVINKQPEPVFNFNYVARTTPKPKYLPAITAQPVVSTYTYQTPSTTARPIYLPSSTVQPAVKQPVVSSYNYITPSTQKPEILVQKQYNAEFKGYDYPRPNVAFVEQPRPIVTSYESRRPIVEEPFVKKTAYVTGDNEYQHVYENFEAQKENVYTQSVDTRSYFNSDIKNTDHYPTQEVYVQSTPRPTYSSTVAAALAGKATSVTEATNFYYYDSRLSSTPRTAQEGYSYPQPTVRYEETPIVTSTYLPPTPTKEYLPVTTRRPVIKNYISTAVPTRVSPTTRLTLEYLPVTTPVPEITRTYVPVRSRVRYTTAAETETSYPSSTYLPARKYPTTPSLEYLPVRSKIRVTTPGAPDEFEVTTRRPAKVVKILRPSFKTIIKQNDIHPILSAKLGAQCTCVSNNLKLRKNQKIIIVEDEEDDDGYAVGNEDNYDSQRIVDITPTPQLYLQSTSEKLFVPSPNNNLRKRVRVTSTASYEPFTEAVELFVKKNTTPAPSDREIADAVRTGLKLVKQAAKEGAREGTEEAIQKERVRDTIECQRAGLFRHPNQCNKFYACRWDCTKNKYTLHTFNCPIHLTFDNNLGACNWPSQGPACMENTLLPSA